ncbi:MAG: adenine phosphoribosyltransferase [Planctomycetota bacterium]|nr:adenine phosphoribosyltransferase [Planctomycetota bacterium]
MSESSGLNLSDHIRAIPDFPKPGILFRDITTLLAHPPAFRESIRQLVERLDGMEIDVIAAAEARGFLFAAPLALELNAALVPVRKPGKLPGETVSHSYELEYGTDTLEIHADALKQGDRVLIVDDLLATGGTIEACCRLVEKAGGTIVACAFLIELVGLGGAKKIADYPHISLIEYD